MPGEKLREFLEHLKEQINEVESMDQMAHEQVTSTMIETDRLLMQGELEASGVSTKLADQFSQLATEIEADHPQVAATIENIIDVLGRIGI